LCAHALSPSFPFPLLSPCLSLSSLSLFFSLSDALIAVLRNLEPLLKNSYALVAGNRCQLEAQAARAASVNPRWETEGGELADDYHILLRVQKHSKRELAGAQPQALGAL